MPVIEAIGCVTPAPGSSISGCTILNLPPYRDGLPKKMKTLPGWSFGHRYLIPLKNTISIIPDSSATITEKRCTALNLIWPSAGSRTEPALSRRVALTTPALIWTMAAVDLTAAMGITELRSTYLNG